MTKFILYYFLMNFVPLDWLVSKKRELVIFSRKSEGKKKIVQRELEMEEQNFN